MHTCTPKEKYSVWYLQSSIPSVISQTTRCLKNGGFRFTKFVSNEPDVLAEIFSDNNDETKGIIRVLGQKWNTKSDCFVMFPLKQFQKDATVYTQTTIFSLVSSIFDPFGHITDNQMPEKWWLQVDKIYFKRIRCTR